MISALYYNVKDVFPSGRPGINGRKIENLKKAVDSVANITEKLSN